MQTGRIGRRIFLKLHTECMCSLMHSTNPLPPIPSASDSIKAVADIKKLIIYLRNPKKTTNTSSKLSLKAVVKHFFPGIDYGFKLKKKIPTKDCPIFK